MKEVGVQLWNCLSDLADTVLNGQSVVTARSKGRVKKPGVIASWSVSEGDYTVLQSRSDVHAIVVQQIFLTS